MRSVGEWVLVELVAPRDDAVVILPATAGNDPVAQEAVVLSDYASPEANVLLKAGDRVLITLVGSTVQIYQDGAILYAVNRYNVVAKLGGENGSSAEA